MKRQFTAAQKAKREVKQLRLHLKDVNSHAVGVIGELEDKLKHSKNNHEQLHRHFTGLRNEFIDQKTLLWKVNKDNEHFLEQNEQLQKEVKDQAKIIEIYLGEIGFNIDEIIELERKLKRSNVWLFNTSAGLFVFAAIEVVRHFI